MWTAIAVGLAFGVLVLTVVGLIVYFLVVAEGFKH